MEKFLNISKEKQDQIIEAGLKAFGQNGYKKASISDIAASAGISKAMIFYYFNSKKELYLYLADLCCGIVINKVKEHFDSSVNDFFDRLKMTSEIKMEALKKYHGSFSFLESMYKEKDEEVQDGLKNLMSGIQETAESLAFYEVDLSKFKDGVDSQLALKFLLLAAQGFIHELPSDYEFEVIDKFIEDYYAWLDIMKNNFYKEEYL
ncbi:MAG: TetR/AcrR family transcriptional regulator [Defluviitaleaceae bacterium]|nr:TetR/AcrR family transcriptional regulator [Defluviitaleaceae bacterium]